MTRNPGTSEQFLGVKVSSLIESQGASPAGRKERSVVPDGTRGIGDNVPSPESVRGWAIANEAVRQAQALSGSRREKFDSSIRAIRVTCRAVALA